MRRLILSVLAASAAFVAVARPLVVGISEQFHNYRGDPKRPQTSAGHEYADAVQKAGHIPIVLARCGGDTNRIARVVGMIDVLLMTGGEDVDPAYYGETRHPKCGKPNPVRDAFDCRLMDAAVARGIPIVGCCRGAQLINAYFGGTLWQDLPSEFPGKIVRHGGDPLEAKVHEIHLEPSSRLAQVLGVTNCIVNSQHHQAVKDVAPGFRVVARAPDGVIEAIEGDVYPAIGLQCHPEGYVSLLDDPVFLRLFRNLPAAAGAGKVNPNFRRN